MASLPFSNKNCLPEEPPTVMSRGSYHLPRELGVGG